VTLLPFGTHSGPPQPTTSDWYQREEAVQSQFLFERDLPFATHFSSLRTRYSMDTEARSSHGLLLESDNDAFKKLRVTGLEEDDGDEETAEPSVYTPSSSFSSIPIEEDDKEKEETITKNDEMEVDENSSTFDRVMVILKLAIPCILSFFLSISGNFIQLSFAGHLNYGGGDLEKNSSTVFAAVSLSNMFANVSALSLIIGMTGALETLASQYNGAGKYYEVGITLQRSILLLICMTIPIYIMWCNARKIFFGLGVDPDVSHLVGKYLGIRTYGIPADVINVSFEKYLFAMGIMTPSLASSITFVIVLSTLNSVSVFWLKLATPHQLAINFVISQYLVCAVQLFMGYRYAAVQRTLQPFSIKEALNWKENWNYIKLGIPGTVMLCSEWWAYELLTVMSSMLGKTLLPSKKMNNRTT